MAIKHRTSGLFQRRFDCNRANGKMVQRRKTDMETNPVHRLTERCCVGVPIAHRANVTGTERMFNDYEHWLPRGEVQKSKPWDRKECGYLRFIAFSVADEDKSFFIG
jgi:hypothetical protein